MVDGGLSHRANAEDTAMPLDVVEPKTQDTVVGPLFAKNVVSRSYFSQSDATAPALRNEPDNETTVPPDETPSGGTTARTCGDAVCK